ncbi:MAG TPA: UTP--glucose-1-phosphate uridylyltransferase, partial [Lactobacillus johnsonii]|nr:UTP--glucose-1-phosphate uridylyltransferase [Lactobacillus johnsonii]
HDVGNKEGYLETSIEYGLSHPQIKDDLREYIINMAQKLQKEDKNS